MAMDERNLMNTAQPLMSTATEEQIITLQQWMSPAFPIGAFAYSHGLEWAIESGHITTEAALFEWMHDLVQHGSARSDAILVGLAHRGDDIAGLNQLALALCPSKERVDETQLQGTAFCAVLENVWGHGAAQLALPVALGQAARLHGIDAGPCICAYLHAFCSNVISVAVRLVPLGQTAGQRVLHKLTPLIPDQARLAITAQRGDLTSNTFLSDVASMRHETLHTRIFKT